VKPLSIRHIKYGVKAEYIKCFGVVIINVLKTTLGDIFPEKTQAAWAYAWTGVSRCITECLNIGSSLVTVALVRPCAEPPRPCRRHDLRLPAVEPTSSLSSSTQLLISADSCCQ
jgi:hypothetical protein